MAKEQLKDKKEDARGTRREADPPADGSKKTGRRLSPERRRAELLECAMSVFARRGLSGGHHAEIAAEAGVSVSTVFVYFSTREELVSAVLGEVERFLVAMADRVHASTEPVEHVFRTHIKAFAEAVDTHRDNARVWLDWSTAIREDVWPRYVEFQERIVQTLASTIERGQREGDVSKSVDPEDDARLIIGAAHMIAQMKFTGQPEDKIEHFMETVLAAIRGAAASPRD
jgi:TetR/AcrR family hemagglutinin/protease transcriptional regulator